MMNVLAKQPCVANTLKAHFPTETLTAVIKKMKREHLLYEGRLTAVSVQTLLAEKLISLNGS